MKAFNASNIIFLTKDYSETLIDCNFMLASKCENEITLIIQRPQWDFESHKKYYEIIENLEPPIEIRPYFIDFFNKTYKILDFKITNNLFVTHDEFSIFKVKIGQRIKD
jgi:hypothetical protein